MNLTDKVVLITGASSGIGAATARRLAAEGAKIVIAARSGDRLAALAESIGGEVSCKTCDVTNTPSLDELVAFTLATYGRIDAAFANAGAFIAGDIAEGDPEAWAAGIDLNVTGLLRTLRAVLPAMKRQQSGHLVLTASVAGRRWQKGQTVYCASKQAVYAIAEGLRLEVQEDNIHVTTISPGWVANEFWDNTLISDDRLKKALAEGKAIHSEDIADAVHFALSRPDCVSINEVLVRPLKQTH